MKRWLKLMALVLTIAAVGQSVYALTANETKKSEVPSLLPESPGGG